MLCPLIHPSFVHAHSSTYFILSIERLEKAWISGTNPCIRFARLITLPFGELGLQQFHCVCLVKQLVLENKSVLPRKRRHSDSCGSAMSPAAQTRRGSLGLGESDGPSQPLNVWPGLNLASYRWRSNYAMRGHEALCCGTGYTFLSFDNFIGAWLRK